MSDDKHVDQEKLDEVANDAALDMGPEIKDSTDKPHRAEDGDGVRNAEVLNEVSKVHPDPRIHEGPAGAEELGVDVHMPDPDAPDVLEADKGDHGDEEPKAAKKAKEDKKDKKD